MITKIIIRNFKLFEETEIDLDNVVVFVGPNNSGKTSALQALSLWDVGIRKWLSIRGSKGYSASKRPGVAIGRSELLNIPIPATNFLWTNCHVQTAKDKIMIEIIVYGISNGEPWECGLEFYYANKESIYCRPLQLEDGSRIDIPFEEPIITPAYLHPMSGLSRDEFRLDEGAIKVRIGEGRTSEVLRNICYYVWSSNQNKWDKIKESIESMFGATLLDPKYLSTRGEIHLGYKENGNEFDVSLAGRGFQQVLLLIAYLQRNPNSVLLIDEPDAHLEILRQREIYSEISRYASDNQSQVIIATHSEVVLNEAAEKDLVIAFLGKKPHVIGPRIAQLKKALSEIRYDDYYQAISTGWVIYLEGSTDLAILQEFAKLSEHTAAEFLQRTFTVYISNNYKRIEDHFWGLKEAKQDLLGIAIIDNEGSSIKKESPDLIIYSWSKNEIENYFINKEILMRFARGKGEELDLITEQQVKRMEEAIKTVEDGFLSLKKGSPWAHNVKVSDEVASPIFEHYFEKIKQNKIEKGSYYKLVSYLEKDEIPDEVITVLNHITDIARRANV